MLKSLVRKLSHEPIAFLKETHGDPTRNIELVRRVYDLDEESPHRRELRHANHN